jgi:hypothetical protein
MCIEVALSHGQFALKRIKYLHINKGLTPPKMFHVEHLPPQITQNPRGMRFIMWLRVGANLMAEVLVATDSGCRVFCHAGEPALELEGRSIGPLAAEAGGSCVAVVDQREIWRRSRGRNWSKLATADIALQSILSAGDHIFCGGMEEATVLRVTKAGEMERLKGFDDVPGRSEWFAGGPPLGVRSLAATLEGKALLAAVHVGGMPRSEDGGKTWAPTIPVLFDVHEVRAHPSLPNFVAAATTVGLCVSRDGGKRWDVIAKGLEITNSFAVAVLESEVLFSIQDGPFAKKSEIWRWPIAGGELQPVRNGLPEWLDGKVDTAQMSFGEGRTALCDGGGNLWLSDGQSSGWKRIADGLGYAWGVAIV